MTVSPPLLKRLPKGETGVQQTDSFTGGCDQVSIEDALQSLTAEVRTNTATNQIKQTQQNKQSTLSACM